MVRGHHLELQLVDTRESGRSLSIRRVVRCSVVDASRVPWVPVDEQAPDLRRVDGKNERPSQQMRNSVSRYAYGGAWGACGTVGDWEVAQEGVGLFLRAGSKCGERSCCSDLLSTHREGILHRDLDLYSDSLTLPLALVRVQGGWLAARYVEDAQVYRDNWGTAPDSCLKHFFPLKC